MHQYYPRPLSTQFPAAHIQAHEQSGEFLLELQNTSNEFVYSLGKLLEEGHELPSKYTALRSHYLILNGEQVVYLRITVPVSGGKGDVLVTGELLGALGQATTTAKIQRVTRAIRALCTSTRDPSRSKAQRMND